MRAFTGQGSKRVSRVSKKNALVGCLANKNVNGLTHLLTSKITVTVK